jgi:KDO2-lipid IV(A) lauroyltransferase
MKKIKYFFEFLIISSLFIIYKFLGLKISSHISGKLFETFGPIFRSKNLIKTNIQRAIPKINTPKIKIITKDMWNNYGRTLSEYMFLKGFRNDQFRSNINITGKEILQKIKLEKTPVIFVSGHFGNFELMAMEIEKSGVNLSAIYRPLNNIFLNLLMERIRKKYICKNQMWGSMARQFWWHPISPNHNKLFSCFRETFHDITPSAEVSPLSHHRPAGEICL